MDLRQLLVNDVFSSEGPERRPGTFRLRTLRTPTYEKDPDVSCYVAISPKHIDIVTGPTFNVPLFHANNALVQEMIATFLAWAKPTSHLKTFYGLTTGTILVGPDRVRDIPDTPLLVCPHPFFQGRAVVVKPPESAGVVVKSDGRVGVAVLASAIAYELVSTSG